MAKVPVINVHNMKMKSILHPHTTLEKSYTSTFLTNHRNTFPWSTNASGIQLCRYSNGFLGKKLIYA